MRKLLSILLLINSIAVISAQKPSDAQKIIEDYLNSVRASAVQTSFELKVIPKNGVNSQAVSGNLIMKANQFYLTMDDVKVWYNGTTQWALFEQNKEVTITEPTAGELAETNPMAVLAGFTAKSKVNFSRQKNAGNHIIELTPLKANDQFVKVTVQFVKSSNQLHSIYVLNRDGSRNELTLKNYRSNVAVTAATFRFDEAKFPGVVMNDLR